MTTRRPPASPLGVLAQGVRLIAKFVRWRPRTFVRAVFGAAMYASAIILSALIVGRLTDELIIPVLDQGESAEGRILPGLALILAVALWKAAGIIIRRFGASWLQTNTQSDIRMRLIKHQLQLKLGWITRRTTGDLLAVTDSDTSRSSFILAPLPYASGVSLLLVGTVVMILSIDLWLGLLTIAAVFAIVYTEMTGSWSAFCGLRENPISARSGQRRRSRELRRRAHRQGSWAGSQSRPLASTERAGNLADEFVRLGRKFAFFRTIADSIPQLAAILLIVLGAIRIGNGAVTPGQMISVAYLFALSAVPVRLVGYVIWEMASSLAGWERVQDVLVADDFVKYGDLSATSDRSGAALAGEEVAFSYGGEVPVLRGVNLEAPEGTTVAIVGATGSGKTTLVLLLARLWDPETGSITLDGRDLRQFGRSELPQEVSYVAQNAFLFDDTVRGNIDLGADIPLAEIEEAARLAGAHGFISALPAWLRHPPR